MKDPRTWNRRDSAVTPNGFFTILKTTGRVSAVRLPGGFRYLFGQPKRAAPQQAPENPAAAPAAASTSAPGRKAPDHAGSQETAILSQSMIPGTEGHRPMRPALIVFAATAITTILLWWLTRQ